MTLDLRGRPLRVALEIGGWAMRGGLSGAELLWVRGPAADGPAEAVEHRERASGFTGVSPAFLVATAAAVPRNGDPVRIRVVTLSDVLGARSQDQRWRLAGIESHRADDAAVDVAAYEIIDIDTAVPETVHIAGDVVLAAASFALADLDSPPGPALHEVQ